MVHIIILDAKDMAQLEFDSKVVRAGNPLVSYKFIPTVPPIYNTTTIRYSDEELAESLNADDIIYGYSRYGNPTTYALEHALCELEGGALARACPSGLTAILLGLITLKQRQGDYILASKYLYPGSKRLLLEFASHFHSRTVFIDIKSDGVLEEVISQDSENVLAVFCETISNPTNVVANLRRITELCNCYSVPVFVDNTAATPMLCRPLELGADLVVHSATKVIGGHGDALGGIIIVSEKYVESLEKAQHLLNPIMAPKEAWLIHRGLKTLHLRLERQCNNALRVANHLRFHPMISNINYLGLANHEQFDLAKSLLDRQLFGLIITFELNGCDEKAALLFIRSLKLILDAGSFGDIYSQICHLFTANLYELSADEIYEIGITRNMLRLSVGIENCDDIISDLDQALAAVG